MTRLSRSGGLARHAQDVGHGHSQGPRRGLDKIGTVSESVLGAVPPQRAYVSPRPPNTFVSRTGEPGE